MSKIWVAVDTKTNRIVGFGGQDTAQRAANDHMKLSGNKTVTRTLKTGMVLGEYM